MEASEARDVAELLPPCCVRIDVDGSPSGSGFFAAPGVIVTCGHVLRDSSESGLAAVGISGMAYEIREVGARSEGDDDLAILRVAAGPDQICALLGAGVRVRDPLYTFGFPAPHPSGAPTALEAEGWMTDGSLLKLRTGQIQPGMSGAPVLNLRTGAVCGVVRRTRDAQSSLGGYAVSVRELFTLSPTVERDNYRYHAANRQLWVTLLSPTARRAVGFAPAPPAEAELLPDEPPRSAAKDVPGEAQLAEDEAVPAERPRSEPVAEADEAPPLADDDGAPDKVEWVHDAEAVEDRLQRRPLAQALAERLRRMNQDEPGTSFLVHVDGPWGSGKSTILRFLRDELETDWLIVGFNAWRQSRVGPPWWALLMELRRQIVADLGRAGRLRLRVAETVARMRRTGAPYALALVLLAAVAAGLLLLIKPPSFSAKTSGDAARAVTAVLAAVATLWAGGLVAARFLLWDSPAGARLYERQAQGNPMENLADHFAWLVARVDRPVLFFVDDLDRCPGPYVVELLEAVQTLVRDGSRRGDGTPAAGGGPYFVVAADGKWIRTSYETEYEKFASAVDEPGRPLGYLFVDKLFQLRVPVPILSKIDQRRYLAWLLRLREQPGTNAAELDAARANLASSESDEGVVSALEGASHEARRALAAEAVAKLTAREVEAATEHALEKFAPLLDPNPRAMKRFVNAFGIARVVLTLENRLVPTSSLALWTILQSRWPLLADHLRARPPDVRYVGNAKKADDASEDLLALYSMTEVAELVNFRPGGPLTDATIRLCASGAPPENVSEA
jgi:hypothetical protein